MIPVQTVLLQLFILLLLPRLDVPWFFPVHPSSLRKLTNWLGTHSCVCKIVVCREYRNVWVWVYRNNFVYIRSMTAQKNVFASSRCNWRVPTYTAITVHLWGIWINYNNSPIWILKRNLFHWDCVPQNSTKLSLFSGWVRSLLFLP